jgi:5-methylcytosine-specific restriction endonuclease McrA
MVKHKKVLILNADYSAIGLISWQQAMQQQHKDVVTTIDFYKNDFILRANGSRYPAPAVSALKEYKHHKMRVPFSRGNVFIRDRLVCQYCVKRYHYSELTLDHVVPRSRWKTGSPTHWRNIVTSCYKCNRKKSCKTLNKTDFELIKQPKEPNPYGWVLGLKPWTRLQEEWVPYLPKHYIELLELAG